jgi:drug/metabolite transporter (DMT)-like permease
MVKERHRVDAAEAQHGTAAMLWSSLAFSLMAASAKALTGIPPLQKVLVRSCVSFIITWLPHAREGWPKTRRPLLLLVRAILGFGSLSLYMEVV